MHEYLHHMFAKYFEDAADNSWINLAAAHHDQGEVVTYQAQLPSNHYLVPENGEAQDQQPRWKDFSCQLPECVMSRANAKSAGISPAGGAQMEHLLARVKQEKTASRARAWEESAKCKAFNRCAAIKLLI